jgi:hypothetical protein
MVNHSFNRPHVSLSSDDEEFTLDDELRIIAALQEAHLLLEPHASVWREMAEMLSDLDDTDTDPEVFRAQQLAHVPYVVDYRAALPRAVFHFGASVRLINASSWDVEPHVLDAASLTTQHGSAPSVAVRQVRTRRGVGAQQPPRRTITQLCDDASVLINSTSAGLRITYNTSDVAAFHTGEQLRAGSWGSDFGSCFYGNVTTALVPAQPFTHGGIWPPSVILVNANLLPFAFRWYNVNVVPRLYEPSVILYTPSSADLDVYENCTSNICEGPSLWDSVLGCPCEVELEEAHFDADFVHNLFPGGSLNCHTSNYELHPCENYARVRDTFAHTLLAVSALFSVRGLENSRYITVVVPHEVRMNIVAFLSSNMAHNVLPGMVCDLLSVLVEQRIYFQPRRAYYTWWSQFAVRYWRLYSHNDEQHDTLFQTSSALTHVARLAHAQVSVGLQFDIRSRTPGYNVPWVFAEGLVPGDLVFPTTRVRGAVNLMPLVPLELQQLLFQYLSVVAPQVLVGDAFLAESQHDLIGPVTRRGRILRYNPLITMFAVAQGRSSSRKNVGFTHLMRDRTDSFVLNPNYRFGHTFHLDYYQSERRGSELQPLCEFVVQRNLIGGPVSIPLCHRTQERLQAWMHSSDCTHIVALLNEFVPGTMNGFKFIADCYSIVTHGVLDRHPRMVDFLAWFDAVNETECTRIRSCVGYVPLYKFWVNITPVAVTPEIIEKNVTSFANVDRKC